MEGLPTLCDVARRAGLSTATVSLALRGSPRVPPGTCEVVRNAAAALGYRTDPMLSALATYRWHKRPRPAGATLALLADVQTNGKAGMLDQAASYGYGVDIFSLQDYPDPGHLARTLHARGILGILVGQVFTPGFCAAFDWSRFVAVACDEGYERPPVHLVMPNHFRAVQEAWDRAWAYGYRRIGLALFDMPMAIDHHDRCAAYIERQRRAPAAARIPIATVKPEAYLRGPPSERRQCLGQLNAWMKRHRPEVVMGSNQTFYWILRDAGWCAPEQVGFIDLWSASPSDWTTGMRLHPNEVGQRAVDWLDALLRLGARGAPTHLMTTLVEMQWQPGRTACLERGAPLRAQRRERARPDGRRLPVPQGADQTMG